MAKIEFLIIGGLFLSSCKHVGGKGVARLAPNVAFRGTATQSSGGYAASRAIDGNFEGSCSYTTDDQPGWWQVDLLEVYMITKVAITMGGRNINNIYIDVTNSSNGSSAQQCAHEPGRFGHQETRVYACPCGMFGRYVRIRRSSDQLALCEVQIQPGGYCTEPEEMDNALRFVPVSIKNEVGSNITYMCNKCYTGGGISTCQCNRNWSPVEQCTKLYCRDPGSIQNGKMEGSGSFACGSVIRFSCNEGYWLLGAEEAECGMDQQWSNGKPSCIHKSESCGEPPKINNTRRFGTVTKVTYRCNDCYTGGGSATCRNGEWYHEGSCNMVPCDNVPDVGNSKRWPTENSVTCGTKVRYTCNQGLTLEGDALECGVGGQLQGQVPVCKKPGDVASEDEENNESKTEKNNDGLAMGFAVAGSLLGGIIITLVAVFLCKRKGIDPCAKFKKEEDSSKANKDYELPNTPPTNVRDDKNDQYAELDDPYLAGYEIPI